MADYYETDDYYYVDSEEVSQGDLVLMPNSQNTYEIGTDKGSLIGVYNINKGYADFKQIQILNQNEEYSIIQSNTKYGLIAYDHIVLDAESVNEDEFIYD